VREPLFSTSARFRDGVSSGSGVLRRPRRVRLRIHGDALEFAGQHLSYEALDEAVLISVRQFFVPSYVLRVESGGKTLSFGVNSNPFWCGELPFAVRRVKGKVRLPLVFKLLRLVLLGGLAWLAWRVLA